jgi:predicted kinase
VYGRVATVRTSPPFVVVSGLAASGKTAVAEPLATELGIPLVSKDVIKEAIFDAVGFGGWKRSKTLSRAADAAMVRIAQDLDAAVLDNFWYRETVDELLAPLPRPIVEVFCRCDPEVAFERFRRRDRHPGHADGDRAAEWQRASFVDRSQKLPLRVLGPVVEVDTERPVDISSVAGWVLEASLRRRG